ncbi:MAG: SDR family oxidoreductase [Hyphomicrobiales bacterium]|nr:SDR family oxidoreductase [Hyphomicrobiales bacterium]
MTTQNGPVLVTGGARRIGKAIVETLAAAGYPVIIHASPRSAGEAQTLMRAVTAQGGRAAVVARDLAEDEAAEKIMAAAHEAFGPVAGLVNNASIFEPDHADDFTRADFDRHMVVNLRAPLMLTRFFAAQSPKGGSVVNIVDQRVLRPNPLYFSYAISKAGLWAATKTMAQAFAPQIRVNAVGPGPVLPNEHEGDAGFAREAAGVPLGRAVAPQEIADAVLFLMRASGVTGQIIAVDSGQHLGWRTPDVVDGRA